MNSRFVLYDPNSRGGTITLARVLCDRFGFKHIDGASLNGLPADAVVIAVQPMSLIRAVIAKMMGLKARVIYVFDTHPMSLKPLLKRAFYVLFAFAFVLLRKTDDCVVPNGPLSQVWPFKFFNICDWGELVEERFCGSIDGRVLRDGYMYIGTCTAEKGFNRFQSFVIDNNMSDYCVVGYVDDSSKLCVDGDQYLGEYDEKLNFDNKILLWTSSVESYGLVFREYVKSGGVVCFLRPPCPGDNVSDAVYVYGKHYKGLSSTLINVSRILKQGLFESSYAPLSTLI